jgi:hypothetical protein
MASEDPFYSLADFRIIEFPASERTDDIQKTEMNTLNSSTFDRRPLHSLPVRPL